MTHDRMSLAALVMVAAFVGGGVASVLFTNVVGAQPLSNVVTTEQLNLVNRSGQLRGILSGEDETGRVSMTLLDDSGRQRAVLAAGRDGAPTLQMYDDAQGLRLQVTLQDNAPVIVANDDDGQQAILGALNGFPALTLADGKQPRAALAIGDNGLPSLQMMGSSGQVQLTVALANENDPLVVLRDQEGRSRATVGFVQDAAVINLSDRSSGRIVLGVNADGTASLTFLDEAGTLEHRVP